MAYTYNNRELSWMSFNERVMQEAQDRGVPLLTRLQFLGIYSNNQDEFYSVRIANLMRLCRSPKARKQRLPGGYTPEELFAEIQLRSCKAQEIFIDTYNKIIQEMEAARIFVVDERHLSPKQEKFCRNYFASVVAPRIIPLILRKSVPIPFLPDGNSYIGVRMTSTNASPRYAIVRVPVSSACPRFVVLPSDKGESDVIFLDDIIRLLIDEIFFMFNYDAITTHAFKIMRDAELTIDDDVSKSLFERIADGVASRRYGAPIRFIYDRDMPVDLIEILVKKLGLRRHGMFSPGDRYHMMKDLMKFPKVRPELLNVNPQPLQHHDIRPFQSILAVVHDKDIFLNYPYHSFQHFIDFLREAAIDPRVESIYITLYRTAEHSKIINALTNAAKNGKQVHALVELKARFDEEQNIEHTDLLQDEGVKVIPTIEDLKVHSKIVLVERREGSRLKGYAYVGTGNFNENTASIYGDYGLLTSNKGIVEDIRNVFQFLMNSHKRFKYKHLLVSPYYMRDEFSKLIANEMRNAQKSKKAYIYAKCNSLTDEKIIDLLYRASQAGVDVRLIIRGACCLRPSVPGMSDNIRAISIVDKYLEHARLFIFCNDDDERIYIGSADWMSRNLDRRVEVCTPILDRKIRKLLRKVFDIQWHDNIKARDLANQERNRYVMASSDTPPVRSQTALYDYYKNLTEKSNEPENTGSNRYRL